MTTPAQPARDQAWPAAEPTPATGGGPRRSVVVALTVVGALVVGGGAFALTRALSGGGDQPAGALPASTAAYVGVDINPSVGQKIAAVRFLDGLDSEVTDALRSEDVRKALFDLAAEEEPAFADLDYDRDIAPWLGDRLAVGVVPVDGQDPTVALSLQVKDQEAADEGLRRLVETAGAEEASTVDWFFHGDYVVVTEADRSDDLAAEVRAGTLDGEATFADDMEALGDPGVLSFWVDYAGIASLADEAAALSDTTDLGALDPSGLSAFATDPDLAALGEGRIAGALRFGTDHIELHGVARDFPATVDGGDSAQLLLDLPEDTAVALGLEHGDQLVAAAWEQLAEQAPDELAEFTAQAEAAGFALPGDIQALLGDSMVLAVGPGAAETGSMEDLLQFPVAYRVSTDAGAAEAVLDKALNQLDPSASSILARRTDDGVLTLGLNQEYVSQVAQGGSLASNATFRSAVPDADSADSILYVNLNAFEDLYLGEVDDEQARSALESVAAIGMSARWTGDDSQEFTLRVVAD
ncbi:MAG TPA: DUF3352 domain-containing protein [Ornithinicoccus sp.]|nr:DUF3352 domain-containing protein [Ornithinicoccus sp.]